VVTMKIRLIVCTFFLVSLSSCFLFLGSLSRSKLNVVLIKDNPKYIGKDREERPIGNLGTLPMHKGETLLTIGRYGGGIEQNYFLISYNGQEVYIYRDDVLTPDDVLYQKLGSKFKVSISEDTYVRERAKGYINQHSHSDIEISTENLLKTKSVSDSSAISFIVTRVVQVNTVEYEIICKSLKPGFDANIEANQLAFFMVTGRTYERD